MRCTVQGKRGVKRLMGSPNTLSQRRQSTHAGHNHSAKGTPACAKMVFNGNGAEIFKCNKRPMNNVATRKGTAVSKYADRDPDRDGHATFRELLKETMTSRFCIPFFFEGSMLHARTPTRVSCESLTQAVEADLRALPFRVASGEEVGVASFAFDESILVRRLKFGFAHPASPYLTDHWTPPVRSQRHLPTPTLTCGWVRGISKVPRLSFLARAWPSTKARMPRHG